MISIVTVVYNGAKHLEDAIKSVEDQTYDNIEYLIIDGQSTDGTLDIIQNHKHNLSFWVSEPDGGIFDAMNKGIRKASGDFIGILNADDWYEHNTIQAVVDKANSLGPQAEEVVIYCDYYQYDEELDPGIKTKKYSSLNYKKGMSISHQALFVSRKIYEKFGAYNLDYHLAADYDFFLRMMQAGIKFVKLDSHGVNIRSGGQSTVRLAESVRETSRIVRSYSGVLSKAYLIFLTTNRLPSLIGKIKLLLFKHIGRNRTNTLRRWWRHLKPRPQDVAK